MSKRQNIARQKALEPVRMAHAKKNLEGMGYEVRVMGDTRLEFTHNGSDVMFYPYSGWHTGKSIKDGRGFENLLKQLM